MQKLQRLKRLILMLTFYGIVNKSFLCDKVHRKFCWIQVIFNSSPNVLCSTLFQGWPFTCLHTIQTDSLSLHAGHKRAIGWAKNQSCLLAKLIAHSVCVVFLSFILHAAFSLRSNMFAMQGKVTWAMRHQPTHKWWDIHYRLSWKASVTSKLTGKFATILHPNIAISPTGKLYLFKTTVIPLPSNHSISRFTCKYRIYINIKPINVEIFTNCENMLLSGDFVAVSLIAGNQGVMSLCATAITNEVIIEIKRILANRTGK